VKPQDFQYVAENLPFQLKDHQMVLSIMAGVKIEKIQKALNHKNVVRAMPNSPTLIGMGITGYTAAEGITFNQILQIERLLNSTGRAVYLKKKISRFCYCAQRKRSCLFLLFCRCNDKSR
jgi:pyrroline-5-carboxylate reductase